MRATLRAPWTMAALALALASGATAEAPFVHSTSPPSSQAGIAGNDLEVSFGWDRWARLKANPRRPAGAVRQTRVFSQMLSPKQSFFAPSHADVTYWPRTRNWELRDPDEHGPTVIRRVAEDRELWLRWDLWRLPRQAFIDRAELRMRMRRSDREIARRGGHRVALALHQVTPGRVQLDWTNHAVAASMVEVMPDFPGLRWDVTRLVDVAHQTGDLHRNLGLVVENAGHLTDRQPELHIWYRIPVAATAE